MRSGMSSSVPCPAFANLTPQTTRWMGRRPGTPDSLPVVGASATHPNVFYNFGHGHMGLTWGPTTGRLLSEIVTGKPQNMDVSPYDIRRFK